MNHTGNCHVPPLQKNPTEQELERSEKILLQVWGMGCPNCARRVRNSLVSQQGVVEAEVDHQHGLALIRHNPEMAPLEVLMKAVEAAGNDGRHHYQAAIA
jgi:copper chaperone CopZ